MKKYSFVLLLMALVLGMSACKNDKTKEEQEVTPSDSTEVVPETVQPTSSPAVSGSFPRKHLIEQFTGEACGYCPSGMTYIADAIEGDEENYVWVANHYGYTNDEYTITESETIGKKFKVSGAPQMMLDRTKYTYDPEESKARVGHPGYLGDIIPNIDSETSYASVNIERSYSAATRTLSLKVSGKCDNEAIKKLLLTVCVKESGTTGSQKDYTSTWEGWSEFVHTKTLRGFMTAALGDEVAITNGEYEVEYDYTLDDSWNAENSTVVAFLTYPGKYYPVINADQVAVVEGTTGGEDIVAHGVTMVPVEDYYPEGSTAPKTYNYTIYGQQASGNYTMMLLKADGSVTVSGYGATPCFLLYFVTNGAATVPNGTYTISDSGAEGTVLAGYRNDEDMSYEGSLFCYFYTAYLTQGSLYPFNVWYVASGEVTVADEGVTVDAKSMRGSALTGTTVTTTPAPMLRTPLKLVKELK